MSVRLSTWLRRLGMSCVVLIVLLLPAMSLAQETVIVQLDPIGSSGVSGTATLTAAGEGALVALDVTGLAPGVDARAIMNANTCAMPSASFAALPAPKADAAGRATATGRVLFHNMDVALATMADGQHVIFVRTSEQVAACGVIPVLGSGAASPALPATGGPASMVTPLTAIVLGCCALAAGLCLRQRSRPQRP